MGECKEECDQANAAASGSGPGSGTPLASPAARHLLAQCAPPLRRLRSTATGERQTPPPAAPLQCSPPAPSAAEQRRSCACSEHTRAPRPGNNRRCGGTACRGGWRFLPITVGTPAPCAHGGGVRGSPARGRPACSRAHARVRAQVRKGRVPAVPTCVALLLRGRAGAHSVVAEVGLQPWEGRLHHAAATATAGSACGHEQQWGGAQGGRGGEGASVGGC